MPSGDRAASPRRVLVAFDKLKHALSARQASELVADVLRRHRPSWQVDVALLTDGGDGFCDILTRAVGGRQLVREASGPVFREGPARRQSAPIGIVETSRLPPAALDHLDLPPGRTGRLAIV
jgi:glycerate kinase